MTVETRSFQELWAKGIIDHDEFRVKAREKGVSDSTIRNYTNAIRHPSALSKSAMMDLLKSVGIKGKPEDLFPAKK